ncbi:MAG: hypothetical protein KBD19_01250 [Candidatus Moranbacteria bacterium]|nr:hypothetical protein [Candidatus Moranbacteria bacterium]
MIEQPFAQPQKPDLSEDDKKQIELTSYIKKHGYTANQIREAYVLVMGTDETPSEDPGVEDLRTKLQSMIDDGFPVNRIGELVEMKWTVENSKERCLSYIDTLDVSENEKRLLSSIVERRRSGELVVMIDNQDVASMRIHIKDNTSIEAVAIEFQEGLQKIIDRIPKEKRYEFSFTEN